MLVLLPPSEGKAPGGSGAPVDLDGLSFPGLTKTRRRVGRSLASLCRRQPARARVALGLSPALDDDRAANAVLWESPTARVSDRYAGVLYDALGYSRLPAGARRRADASLLVFSGLWGALRATDWIPAYRIGIGTRLPSLPSLAALWHQPLGEALGDLVETHGALDLRSTGYSQMYRPSAAAAEGVVVVRVTGPDGKRAAPSYQSKVAKGALVREMLRDGGPSVDALVAAARRLGMSGRPGSTATTILMPAGWDAAAHILPT